MIRYRDNILGYYVPSFFEMHINTMADDLTITQLSLKDRTVLFHEYVHFLQDFTTYFGLSKIYAYAEYIHEVVTQIYKRKETLFEVPYELKDNHNNVLLNQQLIRLAEGDSEQAEQWQIEKIFDDIDKLPPNDSIPELPNKTILDKDGECRIFGAFAITESMAYILERLCSPNGYEKSPDFPYRSAEIIANYYSSAFATNLECVLALCEMSLMFSNPGVCFINTMESIKDGHLTFTTPEDIYNYFYKQEINSFSGQRTLIDSFVDLTNYVRKHLKSYVQGNDELFHNYYLWVDNLLNFALDWRKNDVSFILKMAREPIEKNNPWGYCVCKVGSPLMCNKKGHYFFISPNGTNVTSELEYIKATSQIMQLFNNAEYKCGLYELCKKSQGTTADENCISSPWKKCNDEKLCPYAILWKNWGLAKYSPCKRIVL